MDVTLILPECMYGCEDCTVTHQYKAESGRMMYMCQYYAERFGSPQYLEPITSEGDVCPDDVCQCEADCPNCGGWVFPNGDRFPADPPRSLICGDCHLIYGPVHE